MPVAKRRLGRGSAARGRTRNRAHAVSSRIAAGGGTRVFGGSDVCLRESAHARSGGGFPAGVSDGSRRHGGGKVSRAGVEAAPPARTAQGPTIPHFHHPPA